jgi:pyrimidine-specific ribonucleoside hydrolase
MMNRRQLLAAGAAALTGIVTVRSRTAEHAGTGTPRGSIPLIHITDLYHPPQDPDDHFDLATILTLEEYDLKGVILDATERFLHPSPAGSDIARDPGFIPVTQMAYLLGRDVPVAAGPRNPLTNARDDVADRQPQDQAGVRLLLDILNQSTSRVTVSVVGSCRALTAAYNRHPDLVRAKIRSVLLNAGSLGGSKQEWNVGLDPEAYKKLWRSGLPIHWYPCATERGAFEADHERGTYWKASHAALLDGIPPPLRAWFAYALTGSSRADIIRVLSETPTDKAWGGLLTQERNLWSTASLILGAGRVLAKTENGWRFVAADAADRSLTWPWRMDRIDATIDENAQVLWHLNEKNGNAFLFGRERREGFGAAMSEALNGLLRSFPG